MEKDNQHSKKEDANSFAANEHNLDKNVIYVWLLPYLGISLFLLIIISFLVYVNVLPFPTISLDNPTSLFLMVLIALNLLVFAYHKIKYNLFTYSVDTHGIVIRSGVISRKRIVIPYEKVQNINTKRDAIERIFGTCTLTIETAAGKDIGEGIIPGVSVKERENIIKKITNAIEEYHNFKKMNEIDTEMIKADHNALIDIENKIKDLSNKVEELQKLIKKDNIVSEQSKKQEIENELIDQIKHTPSSESQEEKKEKQEAELKHFLLQGEKNTMTSQKDENEFIKLKLMPENVEHKKTDIKYSENFFGENKKTKGKKRKKSIIYRQKRKKAKGS
ncbi:MAG: PH domain-containing protein [Candidatus Micrarchaeota archaeon]|nr:PH domain-containing protein [Candidatus Micrarchaeota archaeon]